MVVPPPLPLPAPLSLPGPSDGHSEGAEEDGSGGYSDEEEEAEEESASDDCAQSAQVQGALAASGSTMMRAVQGRMAKMATAMQAMGCEMVANATAVDDTRKGMMVVLQEVQELTSDVRQKHREMKAMAQALPSAEASSSSTTPAAAAAAASSAAEGEGAQPKKPAREKIPRSMRARTRGGKRVQKKKKNRARKQLAQAKARECESAGDAFILI